MLFALRASVLNLSNEECSALSERLVLVFYLPSLRSQTEEAFLLFIHDFDESKTFESPGHTKTSSSSRSFLSLSLSLSDESNPRRREIEK